MRCEGGKTVVGGVTNRYARSRADQVAELDRYNALQFVLQERAEKRRNRGWLLGEKKEPGSLSPSPSPRRQVADNQMGASYLRIKLEDRISFLLRLKSPNCAQERKTPSSSRQDRQSAMFPKRVSYRSGGLPPDLNPRFTLPRTRHRRKLC